MKSGKRERERDAGEMKESSMFFFGYNKKRLNEEKERTRIGQEKKELRQFFFSIKESSHLKPSTCICFFVFFQRQTEEGV